MIINKLNGMILIMTLPFLSFNLLMANVNGSGNTVSETRKPGPFTGVDGRLKAIFLF